MGLPLLHTPSNPQDPPLSLEKGHFVFEAIMLVFTKEVRHLTACQIYHTVDGAPSRAVSLDCIGGTRQGYLVWEAS